MSGPVPRSLEDRLLSRVVVDATTGCWEWQGYRQPYGYGSMNVGGARGRSWGTHRVAAFLWLDLAEVDARQVCHRCDNPPCCNPAHLFLGTQADNMRDMHAKGRSPSQNHVGVANPNARLTPADVALIRRRVRDGETQTSVAKSMGLRQGHVSRIARRVAWAESVEE